MTPTVILVGEMRDLETISTALTAAVTGHLVLATLHTLSAPSTIDRIIDVFPAAQQGRVRMQLGRRPAGDQVGSPQDAPPERRRTQARARSRDRSCPTTQSGTSSARARPSRIYSVMQTNTSRGMQTMEQCLADLRGA